MSAISEYLAALHKARDTGQATEHTYRPALKALLETLGDGVQAVNEPAHVAEAGAPDFLIRAGAIPKGHVECKDIGTDLRAALKTDQLKRYLRALPNLVLTDYIEFEWFVEGKRRERASLGHIESGKLVTTHAEQEAVASLLRQFLAQVIPSIGTPKQLAEMLAAQAALAKEAIVETHKREPESGPLHGYLADFRKQLLPDLQPDAFADMVSQTLAYGLFSAWVNMPAGQTFNRHMAPAYLPGTNPFLRQVFHSMTGPDLPEGVSWAVDRIADILNHTIRANVMEGFGAGQVAEDPVIHFYETFLAAYDPKLRKTRGVYYTPEPVVSYIVRSVDHILKTRFNLPDGLADTSTIEVTETDPDTGETRAATYPKVLILDPACGTGTFLHYVIKHIYRHQVETGNRGTWPDYVRTHLLPRLFGFELLMAPYTMAHMKLAHCLQEETGYQFQGDERINVFLTNALEPGEFRAEQLPGGFAHFIAEEAQAAAEVKREKPIMVVIGNPPYANFGRLNKGEWIQGLIGDYKNGLHERKLNLDDDYIKFLRFAQWRVEQTGYGVVGFITNNSFVTGLTHREMRRRLLATFPEAYIYNLHGDANKRETAPGGTADENVFDIRQGVAVSLLVRPATGGRSRVVRYGDLWGARAAKYEALAREDVSRVAWANGAPAPPMHFLHPPDEGPADEYAGFPSLAALMSGISGIETKRDHFAIDLARDALRARVADFVDGPMSTGELKLRYDLRDNEWDVAGAREFLRNNRSWEQGTVPCLHRPFDRRWIIYNDTILARTRRPLMENLTRPNVGLVAARQTKEGFAVLATDCVCTHKIVTVYDRSFAYPLYLYPAPNSLDTARRPNLNPKFIAEFSEKLGLEFLPEGHGDLGRSTGVSPVNAVVPLSKDDLTAHGRDARGTFGPEDVFDYAYAVFHSPTYRSRYAEFLKIDFPRLPLTSDVDLFRRLVALGGELVRYHLLEGVQPDPELARFEVTGSNEVEKVRYDEAKQRVFINKTQHFSPVARDVFEFHIGGYQVLDKWLKDRKGRKLTADDVTHYRRTAVALRETIRLMGEIDAAIPSWPIQ